MELSEKRIFHIKLIRTTTTNIAVAAKLEQQKKWKLKWCTFDWTKEYKQKHFVGQKTNVNKTIAYLFLSPIEIYTQTQQLQLCVAWQWQLKSPYNSYLFQYTNNKKNTRLLFSLHRSHSFCSSKRKIFFSIPIENGF